MNPNSIYWDFENEYVKIKWFDGGGDRCFKSDRRRYPHQRTSAKRDVLYESRKWEPEVDTETGDFI